MTTIADTGMRVLVKRVGSISALVERSVEVIWVIIQTFTKLAKQLASVLTEPKFVQISLFDNQKF